MYVAVKELPDTIKTALSGLGYAKKYIALEVRERANPLDLRGQGRRAFLVLLDIATGRSERYNGSWGGANIPLPEGGAAIQGSVGHGGTYATLVLNPANVAKLLPAPAVELTAAQRGALYAYGAIKPGTYRREELTRCGATDADVEALIGLGLLKKDGRGVSITTAGKNARNEGR